MKSNFQLQSLNLFASSVDTIGLANFLRSIPTSPSLTSIECNQLMHLSLGHCSFDDMDMLTLSLSLANGNRNLTSLRLPHNQITDIGIMYFCQHWKEDSPMHSIDLSHNKFAAKGAHKLLQTIAQRPSMNSLLMGGNVNIGHSGLAHIGELLPHIGLIHLEMYNSVNASPTDRACSPESLPMACALADGLRRNKTLEILHLGSNNIGPNGAKLIMQAVAAHPSLARLWLGMDRSIGFAGLKRIGNELPNTTRLIGLQLDGTVLSWPNTKLAREAGQALLDGVKNNPSLIALSLPTLPPRWMKPIQFHLKLNETCRPLLSSDVITQGVWPHVLAHFDSNSKTSQAFFCLREQPWLVRSRGTQ